MVTLDIDHPDVEEVHHRAAQIDNKISIATVYRTVRLFEEAGIIARHDFRDGRSRYEEAPEVAREILELFIAQSRPLFEEARAAAASGDKEGVESPMHRLKGTTGAVGGMRASKAAESVLAALRSSRETELPGILAPFDRELGSLEEEVRRYLRSAP